jgi:hypothetical protein
VQASRLEALRPAVLVAKDAVFSAFAKGEAHVKLEVYIVVSARLAVRKNAIAAW